MSKIPFMPFYISDYLSDAAHLTTEEHGAYLLLIMTYWQRGKPLPSNSTHLAAIARLSNERWAIVEITIKEFFIVVDGVWRHKRVDDELSKYRDKVEKAKAAGKASGKKRSASKTKKKSSLPDSKQTFNGRSTDVQRTRNHTDTDADSDSNTDSNLVPFSPSDVSRRR